MSSSFSISPDPKGRKDAYGDVILFTPAGLRVPQFLQRGFSGYAQKLLYWVTFPVFVWRLYGFESELKTAGKDMATIRDPTVIRPTGPPRPNTDIEAYFSTLT